MAWSTPYTYTPGETLTAAKLNTMEDNLSYLKGQTDLLFITARNNDAATINAGDPVVIDPTYTSGLGVKMATVAGDMRAFGFVKSASISSGANGIIAIGGTIETVNVTGTVVFGHSLQSSASAHYAQDSGGGGWAPGVFGFALSTNSGGAGTGTCTCLVKPYPLFYTAAQVITHYYGGNDVAMGGATICANAVNATPNQCLLFVAWNVSGGFVSPLWNAQTPTVLQAYVTQVSSYIGGLVGAGAATSNFTGNFTTNSGSGVVLALNGINQGGGSLTFGAVSHNYYNAAGAMGITVTCVPGDMVFCFMLARATGNPAISAESGGTSVEKATGTNTIYDVLYTIATGNSVSFTATLAGTAPFCSMDGLAVHSA